jgi:hypothetical protein
MQSQRKRVYIQRAYCVSEREEIRLGHMFSVSYDCFLFVATEQEKSDKRLEAAYERLLSERNLDRNSSWREVIPLARWLSNETRLTR